MDPVFPAFDFRSSALIYFVILGLVVVGVVWITRWFDYKLADSIQALPRLGATVILLGLLVLGAGLFGFKASNAPSKPIELLQIQKKVTPDPGKKPQAYLESFVRLLVSQEYSGAQQWKTKVGIVSVGQTRLTLSDDYKEALESSPYLPAMHSRMVTRFRGDQWERRILGESDTISESVRVRWLNSRDRIVNLFISLSPLPGENGREGVRQISQNNPAGIWILEPIYEGDELTPVAWESWKESMGKKFAEEFLKKHEETEKEVMDRLEKEVMGRLEKGITLLDVPSSVPSISDEYSSFALSYPGIQARRVDSLLSEIGIWVTSLGVVLMFLKRRSWIIYLWFFFLIPLTYFGNDKLRLKVQTGEANAEVGSERRVQAIQGLTQSRFYKESALRSLEDVVSRSTDKSHRIQGIQAIQVLGANRAWRNSWMANATLSQFQQDPDPEIRLFASKSLW